MLKSSSSAPSPSLSPPVRRLLRCRQQAVQAATHPAGATKAGFAAGCIGAFFDLTVSFVFKNQSISMNHQWVTAQTHPISGWSSECADDHSSPLLATVWAFGRAPAMERWDIRSFPVVLGSSKDPQLSTQFPQMISGVWTPRLYHNFPRTNTNFVTNLVLLPVYLQLCQRSQTCEYLHI